MDDVLGDILQRFGDEATVIVMSDHGFAHFKRQFNLNTWLRDKGYIQPATCSSLFEDVRWSETRAYGLGLNGLYINQRGRERDGIVGPGSEREALIESLAHDLEAVRDVDGRPVIRKVYRADRACPGPELPLAPDLIIGYYRGYRSSWATGLGGITPEVLLDNDSAWSADHCAAPSEVPGILFSNRRIRAENPALADLAPTILAEFGLSRPSSMHGQNVFVEATPDVTRAL
jgi:predicted AlkP superfamily phosphohydrolase/phosphomutase